MVVEGKVVGGDDVDTSILLDLPVCQAEPLALSKEISLGDLVTPVGLIGLLEVTKDSNSPSSQSQSAHRLNPFWWIALTGILERKTEPSCVRGRGEKWN
jgi:hypothetical protein